MHFDILVEDQSGKIALDILLPKIIKSPHSYTIISYKGIGKIPTNLKASSDPSKRILLTQLPALLRGYGKTYASYPKNYPAAVIIVCDLDDKSKKDFLKQLTDILESCSPKPTTRFCFAIEEGEAWFLGDISAVNTAYPDAKENILNSYKNDSICGTWETLADAIYHGGSQKLKSLKFYEIGAEKCAWAKNITPHMDVNNNQSPSFNFFKNSLINLIES
ncbi:DUF4276 family protein [Maridesulfovibrio sp.]|uniref:DUF4276 family protein n=1 Tax=Maridesulfovibrio sp. TaxID=2795000 RepID=UPI002A18B2BF|nr:DUF4276 family protein [Maridesulfovibrio sp.]